MSPRARASSLALFLFLLSFNALSSIARADVVPQTWLATVGAQTHPLGVLVRGDFLLSPEPASFAFHAAYKTVSVEVGAGPRLLLLDGFLDLSLKTFLEPGFYLTLPAGTPIEAGRQLKDPGDRKIGLRWGASFGLSLNYRKGRLWLYSRNSAWAKSRLTPEYDTQSDAVVEKELGIETANAVFIGFNPKSIRRYWVYGEFTYDAIKDTGTTVARPSAGFVVENLWRGAALDIDLNYGLRQGPLNGFGVIIALWIGKPLPETAQTVH